jgi:hypothetical protein
MATVAQIRKRIDRIEQDRRPTETLILWDDGTDPDIQRQAREAEALGQTVIVLRWQ